MVPQKAAYALFNALALPEWGLATLAGLFGLVIGSYFATIILRWPQGRSASSGRSACDHCGRGLGALELIPLFSFLILRGRCRSCGGRVDPIHAAVELACGLVGVAAFVILPPVPALGWASLCWLLIPLGLLDWRHYWLPDRLIAVLAVAGLVAGGWASGIDIIDRLAGAAAGFLLLAGIGMAWSRLRGVAALGSGDPKLLGAIALWTGWQGLPFVLLTASLIGLFWALCVKRAPLRPSRQDAAPLLVPFGTMMALAAPVAILLLAAFA